MNKNVTENVVYSYMPESDPAIRYHSTPSSCAGAADTLAEARASYRADLTGLLHVGQRELPPVIEHVETVVHGMWCARRLVRYTATTAPTGCSCRRCWRTGRRRRNCAPTSIGPAVRASSPSSSWPNRRTPSVRCWTR